MDSLLFTCFICLSVAASALAKKLTWAAALTGGVLGSVIYFGVGWMGIALMGTFFLLGTLATSHKKNVKLALGIAQQNKGARTTGQVLANGGAAGLFGCLAIFFPQQSPVLLLLIAASFSSATADTVSSELGSVYGRNCYDILSLKKGRRGADGVISLEGTLFGILGSCIIAGVYAVDTGWSEKCFWIIVAGTIGNLADSFLGATLERKGIIGNDAVNFFNTVVAALVIFLLKSF